MKQSEHKKTVLEDSFSDNVNTLDHLLLISDVLSYSEKMASMQKTIVLQFNQVAFEQVEESSFSENLLLSENDSEYILSLYTKDIMNFLTPFQYFRITFMADNSLESKKS